MSTGSFSRDPLFTAFSSSAKGTSGDVSNSGTLSNDHLPTGSRLLSYMQPVQSSRKSSHSSLDAHTTLAASLSSSPQFVSSMSPYAAAFQPSSVKRYGHQVQFNDAKPLGLEQNFANSMTLRDHDVPGQMNQLNFDGPVFDQGSDFGAGGVPVSPHCSATSRMGKVSETANVGPLTSGSAVSTGSIGGTTYFFNSLAPINQPAYLAQELVCDEDQGVVDRNSQPSLILPDFYAYSGPLSNVGHYRPRGDGVTAASYFVPDEVTLDLMRRQLLCRGQLDPKEMPDLPQKVDCYHQLVPLEMSRGAAAERPGYFGVVTNAYKANSTKTGLAYCLRRIHNYRLANMRCLSVVDSWKKLQHSNIVQIREVFTTKAFCDFSVVFAYDYYPAAETLKSKYFNPSMSDGFMLHKPINHMNFTSAKADGPAVNGVVGLLPEGLIWCYVIQLSSALRQIHSSGLAARTIDPSKILLVEKTRLLINCCGLFDMLTFHQTQQRQIVQHYQQEDLTNFGRLVLALACNNPMAAVQRDQWQNSVDLVARHYSPDLKNLILYLTGTQRIRNVNDVMPMIGARFYTQLEVAQNRIDILENELTKEADNGRLFRLLCKLGAVNERPELAMDSHWSETGDRYLLKLFRDYLFHQVTEEGRPWLDLAHVVHTLNKVDSGTEEKIMLSSRDQQNVLIVSYADLHRCLDQSFQELLESSAVDQAALEVHGEGQFGSVAARVPL